MDFEAQVVVAAGRERVFDAARAVLVGQGFRVRTLDDVLEADGPGMNSSRQPALVGASRIVLRHASDRLTLGADLRGVRKMQSFVMIFPSALVLLLAAGFLASGLVPLSMAWLFLLLVAVFLAAFAPVSRLLQARTVRALEAFLDGVADAGRAAAPGEAAP